jgi:hypothetical protein
MYPDAQLIGVEGLPERKKDEGLTFDHIFDKDNRQKQFGPNGEVPFVLIASVTID